MAAEGFTRLTYEIDRARDGVTQAHGDPRPRPAHRSSPLLLAGDMEGEGAGGGWSWVLSDLKTLLETGSAFGSWPSA